MIEAVAIGLAAGVVAGLLGVGGGALFVPALTIFLGLSQIDAEATSLLAIIPVALVGAWRQHGHGNVDLRAGVLLGVLAVGGAAAGVVLANAVPRAGAGDRLRAAYPLSSRRSSCGERWRRQAD